MLLAASRQPDQSTNQSSKADMYVQFLTDEGYAPKIEQGGLVAFKKEGRLYLIIVDEKDEQYFRIMFPNFWHLESDDERKRALIACDHANTISKVTKLTLAEDNVCGNIELFLGGIAEFKAVFARSMSALEFGVNAYIQSMKAGNS